MNTRIIKELIKVVTMTIILSFVIDKIVFHTLNWISDKVYTGQSIGKLNQFLQIKDSKEVLVFGNSRANHHIDVKILGKSAYNMGVDGTGIAYSSALLNTLEKGTKQLIIVHIDTKNFFDNSYDGSDIKGLKIKYNRNEKITSFLNSSGHISIIQSFYKSLNYNGKVIGIIKNFYKPNYDYKTYNGYDPLFVNESDEKARDFILKIEDDHNCERKYQVNEIAMDYLKKIKVISESSKKQYLFITSPIYNDKCKKDNDILKEIMKQQNLQYIDYTDFFKGNNNNQFWKDKTHMTQSGAEKFTNELLKQVQFASKTN
ncbi:hypothetical protein [Winogradskyella alexanderae]|uniref:SGNH/GDSL hydrolase family protein n=1 Tax=Winogradskyella alexanderae TaxID=2877123 RepID=A0ABS7XRM8_9FLAO|nr:hypothetical protein [Winogradskyella alexanderae]MCA0132673.1 hypothetical protein [Winogradskyella alexanderae]